jgi:RNA polymerase sigma factor (sigma-70 family)
LPESRQLCSEGITLEWNALVARLGPRLYNYFIRRGFLKDSADLTQDVFSRLYQKIQDDSFDVSKGSVDAFVFGIARFVALENNHNSRLYMLSNDEFDWESMTDHSQSPNLETEYQQRQTIELFLKEIKSLNPVQQEIITLYMDDEMTMDDIASLLKLPVGTVKSHLFRSKEKLKELLDAKGISL